MNTSKSIGGMFFLSRKKHKRSKDVADEELDMNNLLCRFVLDGLGEKIGESIAIDEDIIIIKTGSKYLGVPLKHVEAAEKTLLVKGLVDRDKAEEMGENWRRRSLDQIKGKEDGF